MKTEKHKNNDEYILPFQKDVMNTEKALKVGFYGASVLNGTILILVVWHLLLWEVISPVLWLAYIGPLVWGLIMAVFFLILKRLAHRLAEEVQHNVFIDKLSGVFNFRYISQRMQEEVERANEHRTGFSVLFLDLDNFKEVNDRYGHTVGNTVLRDLAQLVGRQVREGDIFGRVGGDEFVLLMPEIHQKQAVEIAHRLIESVRQYRHQVTEGQTVDFVGMSIGIARYPDNGDTVTAVLTAADHAVYKAKARGGMSACTSDLALRTQDGVVQNMPLALQHRTEDV